MRVGINATSLDDRPSGARQRFIGLYGALFRACPGIDYVIYEPRDCRVASWFSDLSNVSGVATPLPSNARWGRFFGGLGYWRAQLRRDRLDLFESLHLPLIRAPHCPTVLTVHDARPVLPDVTLVRRILYRRVMRQSLRRADRVITVSNTMRAELMQIEPHAAIATIYNGIDAAAFCAPSGSLPAVLDGRFLLAVGHFEPRKNYATLLAAMNVLRERQPDLRLAIVGKDGGTLAETAALVQKLDLGKRVRLLHAVDDATLAMLYSKAQMLVFASIYEGFGIPVLEAMAAGTPMALSTLPVFRELTEGHVATFDPYDASAMAEAIDGLLSSPQRQAEQRAYGEARIRDFTFATLAAELEALHLDLVSGSSKRQDRNQ